jgi:hypothetical protein
VVPVVWFGFLVGKHLRVGKKALFYISVEVSIQKYEARVPTDLNLVLIMDVNEHRSLECSRMDNKSLSQGISGI